MAVGERAVEVLCHTGQGWSVGSGFVVADGLVVTAAHNVAGVGEILVRVGSDREHPARVLLHGGQALDLAVLEAPRVGLGAPRPQYGRVVRDRAALVEGCWAVGFPRFKERTATPRPLRWSVQVNGEIPTTENLGVEILTLRVTTAPRPLPARVGGSVWAGMSGAAVFARHPDGEVLVGVVSEQHLPEGEQALTVVPITAIDQLPDAAVWWRQLGVAPEALVALPGPGAPRPPYRTRVAELARGVLLGRETELAELAGFATGQLGYRWLVGGPWVGKTALAAHFLRACPPGVDWVAYFASRRGSDADAGRFVERVSQQLAWLLDTTVERLDDPALLAELWARAVARAEGADRHLLLVVDGLDEDLGPTRGQPSIASLLPTQVGGHGHVLVTSRLYPELPDDTLDHPLGAVRPVQLAPSPHAAELARRARQNLDEFLGRRDSEPLLGDLLGLLTAAEGPLGVADLAVLARSLDAGVRQARVERLITVEAARVLEATGPASECRWLFAHDTLRERSRAAFGAEEVARYREQIDGWAESWRQDGWPSQTPRYLLDTYPTLLAAYAPERLEEVHTDLGYLERAVAALGVDRAATQPHTAMTTFPSAGLLRRLSQLVGREAHRLQSTVPLTLPGEVTRRLCLQALESDDGQLADRARQRLEALPRPQLVPQWTSKRTTPALLRTLEGHTGEIRAVAVSGDGTRAVSAGNDGILRVWDLTTATQPHRLEGHSGRVTAVAVSGDGTCAVSGGNDGILRVWDLTTATQLHRLEGHSGWVPAVAVSADGTRAVSAGDDHTVRVWDLANSAQLHQLEGHTESVAAVAVSADSTRAVSAGSNGTVRVWDLTTGAQLHRLEGQSGWVRAVAVSGDGTRAVSAGDDHTVRVWDLASGAQLHQLEGHTESVAAVAIRGDGTRAVSVGSNGTMQVWDLASGAQLHQLEGHTSRVTAVAVSGDGTRAVSGGDDHWVRVWDLARGEVHQLEGHTSRVTAVAVSGDGIRAVSGGYDDPVRVWDLTTATQLLQLEGHTEWVTAVAVSGDGTRAVSGGYDHTVRVWDLTTATQLHQLEGHTGEIRAVALSTDGARAVSAGDGTVRVWDLASGTQLHQLEGHTSRVRAVAVSGDGARAVSGGDDRTVRVWDLASGGCLAAVAIPRAVASLAAAMANFMCATLVTGDGEGVITAYRLLVSRRKASG